MTAEARGAGPTRPLRVCIDARATLEAGGVRQTLIGLAGGLSALDDSGDEYLFLVYEDEQDWLLPYVQGPQSLLGVPKPVSSFRRRLLRKAAGKSRLLREAIGGAARALPLAVPESDGTVERAGAHVVHLAMPFGFRTRIPTLYQVYDLQHLHFPEFFHPATLMRREVTYRALCAQAEVVTALTRWGRDDLIHKYGLPEPKVKVIGLGSVLSSYPLPDEAAIAAARSKFGLPPEFAFYPANPWPHKNHLALLDALALLRDRGLAIPLVCCGAPLEFLKTILERSCELALNPSFYFLDYVSPEELRCLYQLCRLVVFPTKFEGWGLPLTEAFAAGRPALCSAIPPLLEQAGDAARTFDPDQPATIADALEAVWTDEQLRQDLVEKGHDRATSMSWDRSARTFRALYRSIGRRALTDEDHALLEEAAPTPALA